MLVNQFNGGENSRQAPHMLQLNEGATYINIDERTGTLKSVADKKLTAISTPQYSKYYEAGNRFVGFPIFTSFVEYGNDLLYCNESTSGRISGNTTSPLGIAPPASYGTVTVSSVPAPITGVSLTSSDSVDASAIPKATTLYALVNVSGQARSFAMKIKVSTDGIVTVLENSTDDVENETLVTAGGAGYRTTTITGVGGVIGSSGVEVYRYYNNAWRMIGVLTSASSSIVDTTLVIPNSARKLTNDDFAKLKGSYQYLWTFYNSSTGSESGPSPLTPTYNVASGGTISFTNIPTTTEADKIRLYRVGGVLSSFALVAQLDAGTTSFVDTIPDTDIDGRILTSELYLPAPVGLTYLEESSGMVFGAVGSTVRFTPIGKPDAWPEAYSIPFGTTVVGLAEVTNGVLVFTKTKTYILVGTGPDTLTKQLIDPNQGCLSATSIQKVAGAAIWVSSNGICTSSGGPAQVITRNKLGNISIDSASSMYYDDVYYCLDYDGTTYAISFAYGGTIKRLKLGINSFVKDETTLFGWLNGYLYELFAGEELLEFEYVSPRFIEGRASELKAYKKFYFFGKGDIIVNIIIDDDTVVADTLLNSGDSTVIQSPQEEQRGHYVQFSIKGKGELLELEYEAARRE